MRTIFLTCFIFLSICATAQDTTSAATNSVGDLELYEYELDINKSKVTWNIGTTRGVQAGEIKFKNGTMLGNESEQKMGRSTFVIDMTSITCNSVPQGVMNTQIVLTLKTDNFFDAYRFPFSDLKFITISGPKEGNQYEIEGLMTIKGKENEVSFTAVGKFHDEIFEGVAKNISIDRAMYGIAFAKQGVDNDVVQQINATIDPKYLIDVYIVADKK